jgi:5-methylthioadenosine/S-adenosylhomocysteine deaminase
MAKLVLKDGIVVTMDKQHRILERASIIIESDRITKIVHKVSSKELKDAKIIDAQGMIVMPGLICAHTHLYSELLRGAILDIDPPSDFSQILQRIWWPMDETLTLNDAYASSLVGCLEFLRTGTTCFVDTFSGPNAIEGSLDYIAQGVKEIGLRGMLSFEVTERHSAEEGLRGLQENSRFIEKCKSSDEKKIRGIFSVHASFTVSDDLLRKAHALSRKYNVPFTIHTSEGLVDLFHNLERYGARTIERLNSVGILDENVVLAHCVQLDSNEVKLLEKTGAKVVHNPMSNMLNAVGVAPVVEMLKLGIAVGLGNDGYITDCFENIRACFLLHKVHHHDPRVIDMQTALEMATIKAAELYGLENEIGSIEVGKKADIILIKPDVVPTPLNRQSVLGNIINAVCGRDVQTVIVNGELLMYNRNTLTIDELKVNSISQKAAKSFSKRLAKAKAQVDCLKLS